MDAITFTEARQNFKQTLDRVVDDHQPVIVTRRGGRPVVVMSLDDYNAWAETVHLLSSPRNAGRLLKARAEIEAGRFEDRVLVDPAA